MGLFTKKQETLNERIKNLRKEKGWTQLKLAEQLNITDKAVSKWEAGEGNPDILLLPKLAEMFGVSIDYLLTGVKPEEKVNLDDMDNTKRAIYLIGKDDVKNFKKYGYVSSDYLVNPDAVGRYDGTRSTFVSAVRTEILKIKPCKILNVLLDDFITSPKYKDRIAGRISPATLVYDNLDEFVKLCAVLNRIDVLEFIKFHWFAIGNKSEQDHYRNYSTSDPRHTYQISSDVFSFIMENPNVNESTKQYVLTIHLFDPEDRKSGYKYYFLNDMIIYCMYHYKKYDLLKEAMILLEKNNEYLIENYVNYSLDGSWFTSKFISGDRCILGNGNNESNYKTVGVGIPIIKAFEEAKETLDIEWIEKFNTYNSVIANKIYSCSRCDGFYVQGSSPRKLTILTEKELELLRMKANPNIDEDNIAVYKFTKFGLLDAKGMLLSLREGIATPEGLKHVIENAKRLYKNHIKKSYIHPCQLIEDCIIKKDYKRIFEFAVDNNIKDLIQPILEQKYEELVEIGRKLFYVPASKRTRYCQYTYITSNSALYVHLRNNCDIQDEQVDSFVSKCEQFKEDLFNEFIKNVLDEINKLTGEREIQEDYERICKEVTKEYLIDLLNKNRTESLVIKLCVKLEAKLKHIYKLSGELKEMLDEYVEKHMKLHNCWDDEDNNYYRWKSEDEYNIQMTKLLNKLRIVRNGIVHSSSSNEKLDSKEFMLLIEFVEKI